MHNTRYAIGLDISTQTVTAALAGVDETDTAPTQLVMDDGWRVGRRCSTDQERRSPGVWVELARQCIADLAATVPEAASARGLGISTTFPGILSVDIHGSVLPGFVSLYDNLEDAGLCGGAFESELARAEDDTLNRLWPGSMAVGLVHLVKDLGLRLENLHALVPPNTAFALALLIAAGVSVDPRRLKSDFTQTIIGGLYDSRSGQPLPQGVRDLLAASAPAIDLSVLDSLLPEAVPSWTNVVPDEHLYAVRSLLGLPELEAVSVGAGDSALGTLALLPGPNTVLNVRGSSDTPIMVVNNPPGKRTTNREIVLHYPMVTAPSISQAEWCIAAPILRTGRVWDWVKRLRFAEDDPSSDSELERMVIEALEKRQGRTGASGGADLRFCTALGGERAPCWDPRAVGSISGLVESHSLGDIALAALEGTSLTLRECIEVMEERCGHRSSELVLAGGPARNAAWNWVTRLITRKETFAATCSEVSVLGAALLGYAASYSGTERDDEVSIRLRKLSYISSHHHMLRPLPVAYPDPEL